MSLLWLTKCCKLTSPSRGPNVELKTKKLLSPVSHRFNMFTCTLNTTQHKYTIPNATRKHWVTSEVGEKGKGRAPNVCSTCTLVPLCLVQGSLFKVATTNKKIVRSLYNIFWLPVITHYWFYWGPTTDVWIFTYLWIIITDISWRQFWPMRTKNDWSQDCVDKVEMVKTTILNIRW